MRTHDQVGHLSGPEWGGAFPGNTIRGAHEADDRITGREHESPKGTDEAVIDGFGDEGTGSATRSHVSPSSDSHAAGTPTAGSAGSGAANEPVTRRREPSLTTSDSVACSKPAIGS